MEHQEKRYWTKEAAKKLGVHSKTLRSWIKRGIGPEFTEISGRKYYTAEALERFLASRTTSEVKQ